MRSFPSRGSVRPSVSFRYIPFHSVSFCFVDCAEVFSTGFRSSGFYRIRPESSLSPVRVYCDMSGGGGWTVLQRRTDGSQRFNRSWEEYKNGFGDFESERGEFWLGNDNLHHLTTQGNYSLRINLEDFDGNQRYAEYKDFRVAHEQEQYRLSFGAHVGTAGDALSGNFEVGVVSWASHQGANFSTFDRDNDNYDGSCAREDQGGWWFNKCHSAHLNGRYYPGGHYSAWSDDGVVWFPWRGWWYSLKATVMELRPGDFRTDAAHDTNAVRARPRP
ncbi:fibrinogen-like protein 1 [Eucyclogobius newberryi]|uniref:fibrinogen-like protein 1 n=1 Tax=Eucyclogobius newberryi TaxID=166745 RepID=UPI003B5AB24B